MCWGGGSFGSPFLYFNSMKNILFVCTANVDRSRTAMDFYSEQYSSLNFKSAGIDHEACQKANSVHLTQQLVDWADLIIAMEGKHKNWIENNLTCTSDIKVLGIEDYYRYYSIKLIEVLQIKMNGIL